MDRWGITIGIVAIEMLFDVSIKEGVSSENSVADSLRGRNERENRKVLEVFTRVASRRYHGAIDFLKREGKCQFIEARNRFHSPIRSRHSA